MLADALMLAQGNINRFFPQVTSVIQTNNLSVTGPTLLTARLPAALGFHYMPQWVCKSHDQRQRMSVGSSSLRCLAVQPQPRDRVFCSAAVLVKTSCFDMAMQRQMPPGPKEFLLLSTLLTENLPLKYQQQEVAISHQHATTAVTSPTSMQDMKGTTPRCFSPPLFSFSRSLCLFPLLPSSRAPFYPLLL